MHLLLKLILLVAATVAVGVVLDGRRDRPASAGLRPLTPPSSLRIPDPGLPIHERFQELTVRPSPRIKRLVAALIELAATLPDVDIPYFWQLRRIAMFLFSTRADYAELLVWFLTWEPPTA